MPELRGADSGTGRNLRKLRLAQADAARNRAGDCLAAVAARFAMDMPEARQPENKLVMFATLFLGFIIGAVLASVGSFFMLIGPAIALCLYFGFRSDRPLLARGIMMGVVSVVAVIGIGVVACLCRIFS